MTTSHPVRALGIVQFTTPWNFFLRIVELNLGHVQFRIHPKTRGKPCSHIWNSFYVYFSFHYFFSIIVALASPNLIHYPLNSARQLCLNSLCLHHGLTCSSRQEDQVIILVISLVFLISRIRAAFLSDFWRVVDIFCPVS